jgi:virginiamycin B lyase
MPENNNILANRSQESIGNTSYDLSIERYVTSMASPRIFGLPFDNNNTNNNINETQIDDLRNRYYTLPSWIKKSSDGAIWFNQQQGNKISRFDPSEQELVEYWIPSQNNEWGNCEDNGRKTNDLISTERQHHNRLMNCGPFKIEVSESDKDLTLKRGETKKIDMTITRDQDNDENENKENKQDQNTDSNQNTELLKMIASGTFTSTGYLGNYSGYFDIPMISSNVSENGVDDDNNDDVHDISFVIAPSKLMTPGKYTLMLGAEDKSVSILKAVKIHIL